MSEVEVLVGDEFDEALKKELRASIEKLGGKLKDSQWSSGGSQDVGVHTFSINEHKIVVEEETYVGIKIIGEKYIVDNVLSNIDKKYLSKDNN